MTHSDYHRLLDKAMRYASFQERCTFDFRQLFIRWKISQSLADQILNELQEQNAVSDRRYAESFVRGKFQYNGWGKIKIKGKLYSKKIDASDIENALQQIDEEEYRNKLHLLLEKKKIELEGSEKRFEKLVRFAQGRGFELPLILDALDNLQVDDSYSR